VRGTTDDELQSLQLEVVQNGTVVAIGSLASTSQSQLLKPFGSTGKVELTSSQLFFELSSAEAAKVDGTNNSDILLRVKARSKNGKTATREYGVVPILVRYINANRYGGRDEEFGGDDWVKPSVKTLIEHFTGITVGDISNMNGGRFPPHSTHKDGVDMDGYFAGYNDRNAATATTIIGHLNDPTYGREWSIDK
jgi:hypothetical protein